MHILINLGSLWLLVNWLAIEIGAARAEMFPREEWDE